MSRFKCNLVVAGFGKTGTSSLHEYLDLHPQICMSRPKEPHFFSFDDRFARGADSHNALFAHAGGGERYFGESSTTYSIYQTALGRIAEHLSDPRLILVLRHPVDRLLSHYRWLWALGYEQRPLMQAVLEERPRAFDPQVSWGGCYPCYLLESSYRRHVQGATKLFGEDRVGLIQTERLERVPGTVLAEIHLWLGLAPQEIQARVRKNATDSITLPRTAALARLWAALPEGMRRLVRPQGRAANLTRVLLSASRRAAPTITEADLEQLHSLLAEEVEYFHELFPHGRRPAI